MNSHSAQTSSASDSNNTATCSSSSSSVRPTQPPAPLVATGGPFLEVWGMQFATHHHLVPKLSMRGAVPTLPLYVFMAWTDDLYLCLISGFCREVTTALFYVVTQRVAETSWTDAGKKFHHSLRNNPEESGLQLYLYFCTCRASNYDSSFTPHPKRLNNWANPAPPNFRSLFNVQFW